MVQLDSRRFDPLAVDREVDAVRRVLAFEGCFAEELDRDLAACATMVLVPSQRKPKSDPLKAFPPRSQRKAALKLYFYGSDYTSAINNCVRIQEDDAFNLDFYLLSETKGMVSSDEESESEFLPRNWIVV